MFACELPECAGRKYPVKDAGGKGEGGLVFANRGFDESA